MVQQLRQGMIAFRYNKKGFLFLKSKYDSAQLKISPAHLFLVVASSQVGHALREGTAF